MMSCEIDSELILFFFFFNSLPLAVLKYFRKREREKERMFVNPLFFLFPPCNIWENKITLYHMQGDFL